MNDYWADQLATLEGDSSLADFSRGPSIRIGGGVTRVSVGRQPEEQSSPMTQEWQPTRVHSGAVRFDPRTGVAESTGGVTRHTVTFDGVQGGSVASTLRRDGTSRTVELIPGNPASRTDVRSAQRAGLIELDASGNWRDTADRVGNVQRLAEETGQAPQQPQEPQQATNEAFSVEEMQEWGRVIDPIPQSSYDAAVARAIDVAVTGKADGMARIASALASTAGMDAGQASEVIQAGLAIYQRAADRALGRIGLAGEDLQSFYSHVRSDPAMLRNAVQQLVLTQNPKVLVDLGVKYQQKRMRGGR